MARIQPLSLLLLVALPISGSNDVPSGFVTPQDLNIELPTATRNTNGHDKSERAMEGESMAANAVSTRYLPSSPPLTSALSRLDPRDGGIDGCEPRDWECYKEKFSSRISEKIRRSVYGSISSSMASDFSVSLESARRSAHDEGVRDGQSKAGESAQCSIDSVRSSTASAVESVSSTPNGALFTASTILLTTGSVSPTVYDSLHATETTSPAVDGSNRVSYGLNLNAGQLAGILVAVFLASSLSSILATFLLLRYRQRRTAVTHMVSSAPTATKGKAFWPVFIRRRRGMITAGNSGTTVEPTPGWEPGISTQTHPVVSAGGPVSLISPIEADPASGQTYPVSPLSYYRLSPPIVPVRFSSLNATNSAPIQRSVGFREEDQTFLLSTDDESAGRNAKLTQYRSESQSSFHSSVISQDLTQFDLGGPSGQPISRFSMSLAPLSSPETSGSSSSPMPQHQQQQQEHPEISPLRPAPPSLSQLRSPVPGQPNPAANIGYPGSTYP